MDSALPSDSFTIRNVRRDFPEWHLGRPHYALWALQVDTAAVRQRLQAAQDHLAAWLLEGYCRQAHITVGLCGFLSPAPQHGDDFGTESLRLQLAALRKMGTRPFGIAIGGLASFSSVPYLTVQADSAALAGLRQCLANRGLDAAPAHYTPHVTVGLYADVWPLAALQKAFGQFAQTDALALRIQGLSLLSYAAAEIGGPLQTLADYDFESGSLHWHKLPASLQAFAAVA